MGTKTDATKCKSDALVTATTANQDATSNAACTGTAQFAVEYPLWLVGIGGSNSPASYAVPNGYCYANACLEDFAAVGTATAFKVCRSSQLFRAARTWPATLPPRQTLVDAPTRLVWLRLLPGTAVRLSSLRAQRSLATPQPARLRRSKGSSGCFPQPDFLSVLAVVGGFELLQPWWRDM